MPITQIKWKGGGTGPTANTFENSADWIGNAVPGINNDAVIGAGKYTVTVTADETINGIATGVGSLVSIHSGLTFETINGTDGLINAGTITLAAGGTTLETGGTFDNNGTINLAAGDFLKLVGPTVNLTGSGNVNLSSADIVSNGSAVTFNNYSANTIQGTGYIGNGDGTLTLNNYGRVYASDVIPASLTLDTGNLITNESTGVLGATNDGELNIDDSVTQTAASSQIRANGNSIVNIGDGLTPVTVMGGQIDARVTGGVINLNDATIVDADFDSAGTNGVIQTVGQNSIVDGGINTANLTVVDGTSLTLQGSIDNTIYASRPSAINVDSLGDDTQLLISGSVSLTGGGDVDLSNNLNNTIDAADASGDSLTTNNIISGAGSFGLDDGLAVTNTGTIVNPVADNNALTIDLAAQLTNTGGSLQALGVGGGLNIVDTTVVGGNAVVGDGSTLTLDGFSGNNASGVAFSFYDPTQSFTGDLVTLAGGANPLGANSTVAGFSGNGTTSDEIDLAGLKFNSAASSYVWTQGTNQGVLAVTEGRKTDDITLLGNYASNAFALNPDGGKGTAISVNDGGANHISVLA